MCPGLSVTLCPWLICGHGSPRASPPCFSLQRRGAKDPDFSQGGGVDGWEQLAAEGVGSDT